MEIVKKHTNCRACGSDKLTMYLSLGQIPLANNLENTQEEAINAERFPLEVMLCENCGLSQLSVVINPEKLYAYYTYRSGVNEGYKKHCREMAKILKERYNLTEDSFHVDIAGNDGTLLKEFKDILHHKVLNIDPAMNLCVAALEKGINSAPKFWNIDTAINILEQYNAVDLITATNVFAHVSDIKEFLEAVKIALKSNGILVIECPYMGDHLEKMEWTQVYFEHLSYISISPIINLCNEVGLYLRNVEHYDIHGGTIRFYISPTQYLSDTDAMIDYVNREYIGGFRSIGIYSHWAKKVNDMIYDISLQIGALKYLGYKIAGVGCSAKGNTLLNSTLLDYKSIDFIYDDTPEKIGRFSPGIGILIKDFTEISKDQIDYLIILSWNFKEDLMKRARILGFKGKFIVPIPEFRIID